MANIFRVVANLATAFAQDINQLVNSLNGSSDVGDITAYPQITTLPTALTASVTGTGSLSGAYSYVVTYVTGLIDGTGQLHIKGEATPGTASTTVNASSQNIALTNIPVGPTGTIARNIYRTKAGGNTYYLAFQIADNTTTSWTDTISDTSLGAQAPTTNSTGSRFVGNGSGLTNLNVPLPSNATTSTPGLVEVVAAPTSGAPIASSQVASAKEALITGTSAQTIATYTPSASGNFEVRVSFRVINGTTNVTIAMGYTSSGGAQAYTALNAQSCPVGEYSIVPFSFNSVSGKPITIQITASVANQVYASGGVTGV